MVTIQELLNRIRWDKEFAKGEFVIGYYDRVEKRVLKVPFNDIYFDKDDHFSFQVTDTEGESHSIPFHRIKEVYKDAERIWHREH